MNKKRILSLLLAIVMIISLVPTYVFATEGQPTDSTVTEPVVSDPVVPLALECETCGALDCTSTHENWCEICKKDDCGQTHTACDKCGAVDCQNTHENWCDVCKKDDCGQTHAACDKCGAVDCQNTHEKWCEICKKDDCGQTHTACDKCGTVNCQSTHEYWCEICKKDDCGQTHTPGNAENPSEPSQPAEGQQEPAEPEGPKVGDKIWIKSGSKVYKNHNNVDKNFYTLMGSYEVEIKKILTNDEGAAEWYEFRFTDLGIGEIALSMGGYKYVHVENTTTVKPEDQQPEDEHACNCGENAPENLANHADSCPRKQYIKTLFEGKTAEEIHSQWETYDEATRNDLLAMLEVYDQAKFEALKKLTEDDTPTVEELEDGTVVSVSGIPEGKTLQIGEADAAVLTEVKADVESHFAAKRTSRTPNEIKNLFAYDISVLDESQTEWQPDGSVKISLTIPELTVGAYEEVYIGHMHEGTIQILETEVDHDTDTISFTVDGFSVFYGFIVDFEYNGYKFSINGGSEVMLSELMKELGINRSVSSVDNVSFSNPSLIQIDKEDGDWKLTSLCAFGTDEWLSIRFYDGTAIEIKVTDPVLFYYLNGTDWCMPTFTGTVNGSGSYVINTEDIVGSDLGATHKEGTADVIIYARPGMAIRFNRYSSWGSGAVEQLDPNTNISKDGLWRWTFGSDHPDDDDPERKGHNYVILADNVTEVKETSFAVKIGDFGDAGTDYVLCEVKIVIVPDSASPTLLKTALASAPDNIRNTYSIRELPVTLYNYDGVKFKNKYSGAGDFFSFKGVSKGVDVVLEDGNLTGAGNANGGGPVMGILQEKLQGDEKLPVMTQGQNVDLFSSNTFDGKEVRNVQFEFVYDTEGYYTYSSVLNHAQLSDDGTKVQLYREAMGTTATYALNGASPNYGAGGFYPYSDIRRAADSAGTVPDWSTWEQRLASGYDNSVMAPFGKDLVHSAVKAEPFSTVDMHNGLQLAANFYLPADKKTPSGQDIVYQFTGDDDLWVFIDDSLVLDIGGGHTPVSGSINFTTGAVTVEGEYYTIGSSEQKTDFSKTFSFEGDKIHSLKIFYLERYAGVSNCRMRFNMPIIPDGTVLVGKELLNDQGNDEFAIKPDEEYTFAVYTAVDDDNVVDADASRFAPLSNVDYTIVGTDETGKTGADGKFTLKAGQTAQISGIEHFTEVYAIEFTPDDGYVYVNPKVSIDGSEAAAYTYDQKTETVVMPVTTINYTFTNYMKVDDLTVTKDLIDNYGAVKGTDKEAFEVELKLDGKAFTGAVELNANATSNGNGKFTLKDDGSVTIRNIPVNMIYSVVETDHEAPSGYEYKTPIYKDAEGNGFGTGIAQYTTVPNTALTGDTSITITNELNALFGHLTITKTGIQVVDDHEAEGSNKQEQQSTMYRIHGTSDAGDLIDMEVIIVDNDSITINYIPVGTYDVYELTNWSWRYEPKNNVAVKQVKIEGGKTSAVEYENERKLIYWLSGDNYTKNWFNPDFYK